MPRQSQFCCPPPWPYCQHRAEIKTREVHLWWASLNVSSEETAFYESFLDTRERRRVERYSIPRARKRFIRARGILKQLLGEYCRVDPRTLSFRLGEMGKPYLPDSLNSPIQFNSTDTGMEAIFAFCNSGQVGVDIELTDRKVQHEIIAPRKFSSTEYELYLSQLPTEQKQFFLSVWTRKEAYGKAKGVGIRYRLNSVNLVAEEDLQAASVIDEHGTQWHVQQIAPFKGSTACLVTEGSGWNIRCFRLPQE